MGFTGESQEIDFAQNPEGPQKMRWKFTILKYYFAFFLSIHQLTFASVLYYNNAKPSEGL